ANAYAGGRRERDDAAEGDGCLTSARDAVHNDEGSLLQVAPDALHQTGPAWRDRVVRPEPPEHGDTRFGLSLRTDEEAGDARCEPRKPYGDESEKGRKDESDSLPATRVAAFHYEVRRVEGREDRGADVDRRLPGGSRGFAQTLNARVHGRRPP